MSIVFLISFGFYLLTLCPTVYVGDSGEFTTAAYTLGITHPPGYPLYVLFGKIFTLIIPFGNIAYRINLMSAFFGALSCGIVYLIVRSPKSEVRSQDIKHWTLDIGHWTAFVAALALAFSKTFWSQSVVAEVYTINAFFIALLIYLSISQSLNLYLFSFIAGVGVAGHYITGLLLPAFLILYWGELFRKRGFIKQLLACVVFFLLGLSVLLFMPVRSSAQPFMDWGNTEIFSNFIAQIRRVQYKTFEFGQTVTLLTKIQFIKYFLKLAGEQFTYFLLPFAFLGLVNLWKLLKKFCIFTVLLFLINSLGLIFILKFQFNPQQSSVVEVYYLPAYTVMAIWLYFGILLLSERVKSKTKFLNFRASADNTGFKNPLYLSKFVKPVIFLPFVVLPLILNFNYNNKRNNFIAYDYSSNILKSLPHNSHFFSSGDNQMFLLSYQQWCLKNRKDLSFYTDTGLLFKNIFGKDFFQLTKEEKRVRREYVQRELLKQSRPVYFSLGSSFSNLRDIKSEITGIVFRAKPLGLNYDMWQIYATRGIDNKNYLTEYLLRDVAAQYHYFLAEKYFIVKNKNEMLKEFDIAGNTGGDVEWVYNNIGISLKEKGFSDDAIKYFQKGIEINPYDDNSKNNLAFLYLGFGYEKFQQKKYNAAVDFYKKAIEISPHLSEPHGYLGVVYEQMNQNELSISEYQKAISLKYDYVDAHYNLGVAYWKIKNWTGVIEEFQTVLQLNPEHQQAKKYLTMLKK
ncbi:MAG: DUF2723 domain-containing protein [Elusimicrobia bacterium]|nr:DUF2723 domain-containing protein [Elusimicrobiota bacterium]